MKTNHRDTSYEVGGRRIHCWLMLMMLMVCTTVRGATWGKYSQEHPLVVVCDWDLPPYEFLDDSGNPAGYTIDLLNAILDQIGIPHTFVMMENPKLVTAFKEHRADVMVAPAMLLEHDSCYLSSNVVSYYKSKIVMQARAKAPASLKDIPTDKVVVMRKDSQVAAKNLSLLNPQLRLQYHAPMEALTGVLSGKYDYFIWGEEPLKWKIKELNLEGLRISNIDVPIAELHVGSFDNTLINAIDDQYARLEQRGELDILRDKWFHPERRHDNASPVVLYVTIAVVVLMLVLFLLNRLVKRNVKRLTQRNSEQTRVMNLALDLGGYMVAEYNPKKDKFKNLRGQLMDEQQNLSQSLGTLHTDDLTPFKEKVEKLRLGEAYSSSMLLRRNIGTEAAPQWQYLTGNCIKERDEEDHTAYLLVAKDITKDMDEQHANRELAAKYLKAFDISLVAMAFYDRNGHLLEMNEQMKAIIGANDENQQYFYDTTLFDAPLFRDVLQYGMTEVMHACQHMLYPGLGLDKYLEYRVRPVFNDEEEIRYYVVTVRDITGERNLYREQLAIQRQLEVTNEEVNKFETQMNYLLSNSNMFIWRTDLQKGTIHVSRSLNHTDFSMSIESYLESMQPAEQESARNTLLNPLMRNRPISYLRHFTKSPVTGSEAVFAISGTPTFDKNGMGTGHFGICRDVTQLIHSQEELRRETARAQQSGTLKATFLANMTHEIRTPLNAIVGFSDLLHMATTSEERKEFIHIIRHNCDLLLRLIDDLLETSEMNEKPQRIEAEDIDFSKFFDEVCQTVAQRVQLPSVTFIKDNPEPTFPARTDSERIQQVITNFVTNAVKYTREGHIKVGYRAMAAPNTPLGRRTLATEGAQEYPTPTPQEGIYIYCEDTGAGIPKEQQASVFDRFVKLNDYVQGTGLGLSICKSIAERCGGDIGVVSEGAGKGSTFWLWIPRFLTLDNLTAEKQKK